MRKVWSGEVVEHQSEFLSWTGFKSYPRPLQDPMPVVIGGSKGRIYERIARHGNGWFVPGAHPGTIEGQLAELRQTCERLGRDFAELEITTMWSGQGGLDGLEALDTAGVHRAVVPLMGMQDPAAAIQRLGEDVITRL
jgi:alkanesulfonate monooxygenase SsuD/methylene tetrahydromethanopterin reductase-like flavin-dependent oxidoreductase (luciferase family)